MRSRGIAWTDAATGGRGLHLLPLLDFANHREAPRGDTVVDASSSPPLIETEDGVTVLCAPTDLARGDEITFEYTADGNERLLMDYGFAALDAQPEANDDTAPDTGSYEYVGLEQLDTLLQNEPAETIKRLGPSFTTH